MVVETMTLRRIQVVRVLVEDPWRSKSRLPPLLEGDENFKVNQDRFLIFVCASYMGRPHIRTCDFVIYFSICLLSYDPYYLSIFIFFLFTWVS